MILSFKDHTHIIHYNTIDYLFMMCDMLSCDDRDVITVVESDDLKKNHSFHFR